MDVLIINGHDYSRFVERKGYGWSRNDLDSEETKRTKGGVLRRDKIGTKRKLEYKIIHMTREELAALDDDLSAATFSATYLDLHGPMSRKFYCSSFTATLSDIQDGNDVWEDGAFSMIEV